MLWADCERCLNPVELEGYVKVRIKISGNVEKYNGTEESYVKSRARAG